MKIGVCVKQVPDTASRIRVKEDRMGVSEEGIKFVISPYDEYAVEESIRTKEKIAGSDVTVLTVGPKRSQEALRSALAMGCDKAVHVNTDASLAMDSLGVARVLAARIKELGLELVFTGRHAADDDSAQVSQMLAEVLGWPHVTVVSKFSVEVDGRKARVERDVDGGAKEVWEVEFPAVLAATKGLNEPRYASLKGIMQAKSKPLTEVALAQAGVSEVDRSAKMTVRNFTPPPERKPGRIIKGDPAEAVSEVVRLLREEAKAV